MSGSERKRSRRVSSSCRRWVGLVLVLLICIWSLVCVGLVFYGRFEMEVMKRWHAVLFVSWTSHLYLEKICLTLEGILNNNFRYNLCEKLKTIALSSSIVHFFTSSPTPRSSSTLPPSSQ